MTETTAPRQLGDATVLRTRTTLSYTDTLAIHEARNGHLRLSLDTKADAARTSVNVASLPELIRTLIARSGRTDLELVVTEPDPDDIEETTDDATAEGSTDR